MMLVLKIHCNNRIPLASLNFYSISDIIHSNVFTTDYNKGITTDFYSVIYYCLIVVVHYI